MEYFRCRGCSQSQKPPVHQCFCGHPYFICPSCNGKHPQRKCSMCICSKSRFKPCPSMDKLLSEIVVPGKRGCAGSLAYDRCPASGCDFGGERVELLDHFATHHKWPTRDFKYGEKFDVPGNPGLHVLRGADDGQLFVLTVAGREVSFFCVQPRPQESQFQCTIFFTCISVDGRAEHVPFGRLLYPVQDSSISDVSSKDSSCILPNRQRVTAVLIRLDIRKMTTRMAIVLT